MLSSAYDEFQKNQSATLKGELLANAADQYLTAVKDAGAARDWGAGEQVLVYFAITAAAAANPGTNTRVRIIGSDTMPNVNGTDGTNPVTLADSGTIATALLGAGSLHRVGYLASGASKRYLGAKVTNVGGNPTTGAIVCGFLHKDGALASYGDLTNSIQ